MDAELFTKKLKKGGYRIEPVVLGENKSLKMWFKAGENGIRILIEKPAGYGKWNNDLKHKMQAHVFYQFLGNII